MRFHLGLLGVLFVLAGLPAFAQGPDTSYVRIYHVIQEADTLRQRGQDGQAIRRFQDAQRELLHFQQVHPNWNKNIVSYRLSYIKRKLETLYAANPALKPQPKPVAVPAATQETNTAVVVTPPVTPPPPNNLNQEKLQEMQGEIQRLSSQNQDLQNKLKEAWAAQPTALDPAELEKARQRILSLEKERDLLEVALQETAERQPLPGNEVVTSQEQEILAQVRKELDDQKQVNMTLQQENAVLKKQVEDLKVVTPVTPIPDSDLARQYAAAQATIEELRATNVSLRTEQILLQNRMNDVVAESTRKGSRKKINKLEDDLDAAKDELDAAEDEVKKLTKSNDQLAKQLAAATRRLERRAEDSEVEQELLQAQAQLDALQSAAVPFTPEERALIDHRSDVTLTSITNEPAKPTRKVRQLPPGAGPLMAQAERHIESGQFEEAEKKLRDILNQDENNIPTLFRLAGVLLDLKRPEEAEKVLQKALEVDSEDAGSNFLMGLLKYQAEKYDDAFNALSLSAKYNDERPETQYYLGLTLLQKGNRGPAETAFRKAIQLRPGWGDAHYELAVVYATQNPPFMELAEWHYQKAISGGTPRNFNLEKLLEGTEGGKATP